MEAIPKIGNSIEKLYYTSVDERLKAVNHTIRSHTIYKLLRYAKTPLLM